MTHPHHNPPLENDNALAVWIGFSVTYFRVEYGEGGFGEFPLERCGDLLVANVECQPSGLGLVASAEVVGRKQFRFQDGEVHFNLFEPKAWTGKWISRRLGQRDSNRSKDGWPR